MVVSLGDSIKTPGHQNGHTPAQGSVQVLKSKSTDDLSWSNI